VGKNLKKISIFCFMTMAVSLVLFTLASIKGYSEILWRLLLVIAGFSFIFGIICYCHHREKK